MTLQNDLKHFSGTEQYYKLSFTPLLSTDGVKYFADKGQAYWLIGDISAIHLLKRRKYDFIAVTVKSSGGDVIAKYTDGYLILKIKQILFDRLIQQALRELPYTKRRRWTESPKLPDIRQPERSKRERRDLSKTLQTRYPSDSS